MSNLTRLQSVSSSLDTAINKANALPDAGSGASIEAVELTVRASSVADVGYTSIENQDLVYKYTRVNSLTDTTITVIKNSLVSIQGNFSGGVSDISISTNGCEVLDTDKTCVIIGVYGGTNGTASINISCESNSGGTLD